MPKRLDLPLFDANAALAEIEMALRGADLERSTRRILDFRDTGILSEGLSHSAVIINARYADLRKQQRNGSVTHEELSRGFASLTEQLLFWCSDATRWITEHPVEEQSPFSGDKTPAPLVPSPTTPIVRIKQLTHEYRGFRLHIDDLELDPGQMIGIVGPNGSGKTTLLRLIAGELRPSIGSIGYPGLNCSARDWYSIKQKIAYVAQAPRGWRGLTIDNLRFDAAAHGRYGEENEAWVSGWVARLQLGEYRNNIWSELSGGFKTRFELARALVRDPLLLILDEPLASLDPSARITFLWDLRKFCEDRKLAIFITSQHLHEVEAFAHRVIYLLDGKITEVVPDGRIYVEFALSGPAAQCHDLAKSIDSHYCFNGYSYRLQTSKMTPDEIIDTIRAIPLELIYFRNITKSAERLS